MKVIILLTNYYFQKLVEFNAPSQWTFDMGWCERNPYLVASSSFSGKLSVFSLFGGQEDIPEQPQRVSISCKPHRDILLSTFIYYFITL